LIAYPHLRNHTMYAPIQIGTHTYPAFRSESMFESFADYLAKNTIYSEEFEVERCIVTGQPVGRRDIGVIQAMVRMVANEVVGRGDKDLLNPPTQGDIEYWAETVFERISYRLTMTSRPSPLFAVSGGRMVLGHMSQEAQTVALL